MNSLTKLWTYSHTNPILRILTRDLNGNGQKEIIVTTQNGELLILNTNGTLLFKDTITEKKAIYTINVRDITQNGNLELIIGSMDGLLRTFTIDSSLHLHSLWAHTFGGNINGILIDDITLDSKLELIVYSLDKSLRVLNSKSGELIWAQMFEKGIGDAKIIEDINFKSQKIIVACGNDGTLRIFRGEDGELLWFKKFDNKLRTFTTFSISDTPIFICGGDEKELYYINRENHATIAKLSFSDYIWSCKSYPIRSPTAFLMSTYSYAYLYPNDTQNLAYTSQVLYLNTAEEISWQLQGLNVEKFKSIKNNQENFIALCTTEGCLLLVEEKSGKIHSFKHEHSCINDIAYNSNSDLIFTSNDSGEINAYSLKK
ncbi:MAG: hypothetical protein ACQERB_15860 [Promethearchaeati archaeon]